MNPREFADDLAAAVTEVEEVYVEDGARARPGTMRRLRRHRAASTGSVTAVTAAVVATAWLGVAAAADPAPLPPAGTPTAAPTAHFVTAFAGRDLNRLALEDPSLQCGAPAPTPVSVDGDITLSQEWATGATEGPAVVTDLDGEPVAIDITGYGASYPKQWLTYTGDTERVPAHIAWSAVYVQDGTIVGFAPSFDPRYRVFYPDKGYPRSFDTARFNEPCELKPDEPWLPAGEYQVYAVARVVNNPELAAYYVVQRAGYSLETPAAGAAAECSEEDAVWLAPAVCAGPDAPFAWDEELGAAIVWLDPQVYTVPIDSLLIGEPFTAVVTNPWDN